MVKEKSFKTSVRIAYKLGVTTPAKKFFRNTPGSISKMIEQRVKLVDDQAINTAMRKVAAFVKEQGIEVDTYLKLGVYNGSTITAMPRALDGAGINDVRVFGFDTFEGLPDFAITDCGGHWKPGQFHSSIEFTRSVLEYERVDMCKIEPVK